MEVLIGCEFSGVVRDAFARRGHNVVSCDLLGTEHPGTHYKGNITDLLNYQWDLLIAFPPCTHLAVSGARWFPQKVLDGRQQSGIDFFMALASCNIPKICIENPVGIMSTRWRKPNQIIQPWQFGHQTTKATCLWLKGLPLLTPTSIVSKGQFVTYASGRKMNMAYSKTGGGDGHKRSVTFQGIGDAMADQWG
jgi:site-specific DNA-cytosine methylase